MKTLFLFLIMSFLLFGCDDKENQASLGLDKEIVYTCVDDVNKNLGESFKTCITDTFKSSNNYEYAKSVCSSNFRNFDVKFYECLDSKGE